MDMVSLGLVRNISGMCRLSCVSRSQGDWDLIAETLSMFGWTIDMLGQIAGPQGTGAPRPSAHLRTGPSHASSGFI